MSCESDAGIEDFGRELPHAFGTGIDIGDGLGHQCAGSLGGKFGCRGVNEISVQDLLHAPVDVVRKISDIQAFDGTGALNERNHNDIRDGQLYHRGKSFTAAKDVIEHLGKLTFEPGTGEQTDIVDKAGNRDNEQREPLSPEVRGDMVRMFNGSAGSDFE